jgi:hypothetical protein
VARRREARPTEEDAVTAPQLVITLIAVVIVGVPAWQTFQGRD